MERLRLSLFMSLIFAFVQSVPLHAATKPTNYPHLLKAVAAELNQAKTLGQLRDLARPAWTLERQREMDQLILGLEQRPLPKFKVQDAVIRFEFENYKVSMGYTDIPRSVLLINNQEFQHDPDRPMATTLKIIERILNNKDQARVYWPLKLWELNPLKVESANAFWHVPVGLTIAAVAALFGGGYGICKGLKKYNARLADPSAVTNFAATPKECDAIIGGLDWALSWVPSLPIAESDRKGEACVQQDCSRFNSQGQMLVHFCTKNAVHMEGQTYQRLLLTYRPPPETTLVWTIDPSVPKANFPIPPKGKPGFLTPDQIAIHLKHCTDQGHALPGTGTPAGPAAPVSPATRDVR